VASGLQVSRRAYAVHTEYVASSSDGPGVIVGVYGAEGAAGKQATQAADTRKPGTQTALSNRYGTVLTSYDTVHSRYDTVQIAWLRTNEVQTCPRWLIEDRFLVEARTERVVGSSQWPAAVGMRVRFLDRMRFLAPLIYSDSGGGPGTISWVSPWDAEGKGNGGGVCQVIWDWTAVRDTYRTGYKGDFNLRLLEALGLRDHQELASILKSTPYYVVCYIVHILGH
jgi:hypothetical protein